jgi:NAD(P)-dependent dehydrogenase (short-subunit alcohol dehydrogenase family)
LTADDWTRVLTTNLSGAFFCAQAFARAVIAAKMEGCIVNVASIFGLTGGPNRAAYSASKAGLVNLTRVLAYEWQPFGIRVNAVAPTFVRTPLTDRLLAGGLDIQNRALGERLATPEDVAEAVYFLSSHAAAMIAGHTLPVDGGWLAW